MSNLSKDGIIRFACVMALVITTSVNAQSEDSTSSNDNATLEEIIVTAQKRSENQQDVPVAVSTVSGVQLEKAGITNILDIRNIVPALNITYTNGYVTSSLRGIGTNGVGLGIENPVALYIDGVYIAGQSASLLTLNNIAQIEVLKGPQGTLFGRNATGGLIQVFTRNPMDDPGSEVGISYENYDTATVNAYLSARLSDGVAADVSVRYKSQGEGFGTNLITGEDVYKVDHDFAVRSKWVFDPSDTARLTFIADYSEVLDSLSGFRLVPGTVGGFPVMPPPEPPPVPEATKRYDVVTDYQPMHDHYQGGATFRWEQEFGDYSFSSITAYRQSRTDFNFDYDETSQPVAVVEARQRDSQFSQEFQLSSPVGSTIKWVAGAYYFLADADYDPLHLNFVNLSGADLHIANTVTTESIAGFVEGSYALGDNTNLTLGGRYTVDDRGTENSTVDVSIPAIGLTLPTGVVPPQEASFSEFTYRVSIDHRFSDQVLAYGSVNTGFKSGGFNGGDLGAPPFDPETITAYEIGFKTDLAGRRVRLNGAVYYYDYQDVQIQNLSPGGIIRIINGASAIVYGFDMDATVLVSDNFLLTGGVLIASPDFDDFASNCPVSAPEGGVPVDPVGDCSGNQLPLASELIFNIGADYTVNLASGNTLNLNANAYYNSGFFPESDNTIEQPSFWQLSAAVTWVSSDDRFSVGLFGKNLTDEYVMAYETTEPSGTHQVIYAPPRTYGIEFAYRF